MAPAKQKNSTEARSLFQWAAEEQSPIKPGDIVRQNWPWIGHYVIAYPYFHVRGSAIHDSPQGQILEFLCHAVPYGACPTELSWFPERYLVNLGYNLVVPSHDILMRNGEYKRYSRQAMGDPPPADWPAKYMEKLKEVRCQRVPAGGASPYHKEGAPWPDQPPFKWERKLVRFLDRQKVKWWEVARDNWYEKFPEDLEADNGIRKKDP